MKTRGEDSAQSPSAAAGKSPGLVRPGQSLPPPEPSLESPTSSRGDRYIVGRAAHPLRQIVAGEQAAGHEQRRFDQADTPWPVTNRGRKQLKFSSGLCVGGQSLERPPLNLAPRKILKLKTSSEVSEPIRFALNIGYVDEDGFVFIIDRKKDMIISAGENIFSAEIERVLSFCEDYLEVAVFGIPDDRLGEVAIAAVTPRAGAEVDAAAVKTLVGTHLAAYKVPAHVLLDLGPLPRNALGKVDKAAVRRKYLEGIADGR